MSKSTKTQPTDSTGLGFTLVALSWPRRSLNRVKLDKQMMKREMSTPYTYLGNHDIIGTTACPTGLMERNASRC